MRRLMLIAALLLVQGMVLVRPAHLQATAGLLQTVKSPDWAVEVRGVTRRSDPLPGVDGSDVRRAAGRYVILLVDLSNLQSAPAAPQPESFRLHGNDGVNVLNLASVPEARQLARSLGYEPFGNAVPAGATVQTILVFDIDPLAGRLELDFLPANTTIEIAECHCDLPSPQRTITGLDQGD